MQLKNPDRAFYAAICAKIVTNSKYGKCMHVDNK